MKLLSVIIPAFNMERYLSQTIHSLLVGGDEQSALDIVVVNDGSNDQTSNIAHHLASKYSDVIRVIDKPNGHYGSCINAALKVLRGQFVRIIDADDSVVSENFRKFVSFLIEKNNDASFATVDCFLTDSLRVSETGDVLSKEKVPISAGRILAKTDIPRHFIFQMYAVTYRTSILFNNHYRQTEGILYTDTEWMAYPLTWVRNFYYWSGYPVYRYLIGRAGQSIDPQVYNCCIAQRIEMFARMMRESNNTAISGSDRYRLLFVSEYGIMAIYRNVFNLLNANCINKAIKEIDDIVLGIGADVYQRLLEVPLSHHIPIRMLKLWRRRGNLSRVMILLIYVVINVDSFTGRIRRVVRKILSHVL